MPAQSNADSHLAARVEAVTEALRASDTAAAIMRARAALDEGLVHPLLLNLRAFWYESEGQLVEALRDLERAHALAPDDAQVANAYGLALARQNRLPEAISLFSTAIASLPDFAPAHFNRGWASESVGEMDAARESFEEAVRLTADRPGAVEALARLAVLAVRRGDWDEARRTAATALAIAPGQRSARLSDARAQIGQGNLEAAERGLEFLCAEANLDAQERYDVLGALGDLRHAQMRYTEAYRAYADANLAIRADAAGRFAGSETALDLVRWIHRAYADAPVRRADRPDRPATHAFLLGFIRSGTTLLEQVLASHPGIVTMEEKEAMEDAARKFLIGPQSLAQLWMARADERQPFVDAYWHRVRGFGLEPEGRQFVDKHPFNTVKLPLIAELFPSARVLFALRDPRDVILSCFRQRFRMNAYTYELLTLEDAARFYDAYMTMAMRLCEVLPLQILRIRHEDLVENFDGEVSRVCDFLGIAWTDAMRDFAERRKIRAIATPSAPQIAKGLNREGVGQWRNYREEMAPILPILEPWITQFGYPDA